AGRRETLCRDQRPPAPLRPAQLSSRGDATQISVILLLAPWDLTVSPVLLLPKRAPVNLGCHTCAGHISRPQSRHWNYQFQITHIPKKPDRLMTHALTA